MLQKSVVIVLALCGLFAVFSNAMPFDVLPDIDDCRLCEHIVGAAERHHHNNFNKTTQDQLKRELDRDCFQFTHTHGGEAAKKCMAFINAHIATIYTDVKAGKRPKQVCTDIGACGGSTGGPVSPPPPTAGSPPPPPASGSPPPASFAPEELPQHDPCQTCAFIVGRAEHHFKKNETADQLKGILDQECKQLAHLQGQQAAEHCKKIVDNNIQTIYNDIKAGKRPHQICIDIGECGMRTGATGAPPSMMSPVEAFKIHVEPRPHDPCRTCEFIIMRAEHHMHNGNVTDKNRLLRELEHECIRLAQVEGDQASVHCLNIVQKDIDMIFNDIKAGKRPRGICEDMGECTSRTVMPMSTMGPMSTMPPMTAAPMSTMPPMTAAMSMSTMQPITAAPMSGTMQPLSTMSPPGLFKKLFNIFHH